ncbi:hypothetical protein PFISCL1PPCAC_606, partial [Pristionchus fissidentatus]
SKHGGCNCFSGRSMDRMIRRGNSWSGRCLRRAGSRQKCRRLSWRLLRICVRRVGGQGGRGRHPPSEEQIVKCTSEDDDTIQR